MMIGWCAPGANEMALMDSNDCAGSCGRLSGGGVEVDTDQLTSITVNINYHMWSIPLGRSRAKGKWGSTTLPTLSLPPRLLYRRFPSNWTSIRQGGHSRHPRFIYFTRSVWFIDSPGASSAPPSHPAIDSTWFQYRPEIESDEMYLGRTSGISAEWCRPMALISVTHPTSSWTHLTASISSWVSVASPASPASVVVQSVDAQSDTCWHHRFPVSSTHWNLTINRISIGFQFGFQFRFQLQPIEWSAGNGIWKPQFFQIKSKLLNLMMNAMRVNTDWGWRLSPDPLMVFCVSVRRGSQHGKTMLMLVMLLMMLRLVYGGGRERVVGRRGGWGWGGRNSVIGPPSICFLLSIFTHRSGHSSLLLTFFLGRWRFSPFPPARPWMYLLMFINIDVCHIPSCGQSINHAPITFISNDQRCRPVNNHQL